jgi:GYF domain 2
MSLKCFYVADGAAAGPVSAEELMRLGRSGEFARDNLVWIEGTADWQPFATWSAQADEAGRAPILPSVPVPPSAGETAKCAPAPEVVAPIAHRESPEVSNLPAASRSEVVERLGANPATNRPLNSSDVRVFQRFARISWISMLVGMAFAAVLVWSIVQHGSGRLDAMTKVASSVGGAALLLTLVSGIAALCGIPRHGRKGILPQAVAGLLPLVLLVAFSIPGWLGARQRAREFALEPRAAQMLPVQVSPDAKRITHPSLGFSLDVPAGLVEFPSNRADLKLWKLFGRPPAPGDLAEVFGIQPLGMMLPRRHLDPRTIPGAVAKSVHRVSWRGVMVDAVRLPESKDGKNYVTYNVQIPLKGEAIQLMLGAPAEREAELKSRIDAVLASLDGPNDW